MTEKPCSKCGAVLPLDAFDRRADDPERRLSWCRACNRARMRGVYTAEKGKEMWQKQKARQEARLAFVAEKYDESRTGRRVLDTIAINKARLAVMDRTGIDVVREGLLRFEFSRADCLRVIEVLESERMASIRRLEKETRITADQSGSPRINQKKAA